MPILMRQPSPMRKTVMAIKPKMTGRVKKSERADMVDALEECGRMGSRIDSNSPDGKESEKSKRLL
jgi:hypothetical protein